MNHSSKIYIAGHTGMVGSALIRRLKQEGYKNLVLRTHAELDLLDQRAVEQFFKEEKPEYVFLAAAKVGGIMANNTYRAQFIYENLQIQNNVIHQAYLSGVKKLLFLGSSCIYPKNAPQPLKEEYLLTSDLEYTNEPYAIAKIAGIKMCEAYNIQYGTNYISVMPTNLYGPNDNYDLETSHAFPALLRKIHLGKCLENDDWEVLRKDLDKNPIEGINGQHSEKEILQILEKYGIRIIREIRNNQRNLCAITLWGTGSPYREFLHVDDMADACLFIMQNINFRDLLPDQLKEKNSTLYALRSMPIKNTHINIGCGEDLSIKELAGLMKEVIGYHGDIIWDKTKPDGTPRKLMDVSKMKKLGWKYKIGLKDGIEKTYNNYLLRKA